MAAPHSVDLPQKNVQAYAKGMYSPREIAELFNASPSFVEALFEPYRHTSGKFVLRKQRSGHHVLLDEQSDPASVELMNACMPAMALPPPSLPPYFPDRSLIDSCWSKIKACMRGRKAHTSDALDQALSKAINTISQRDARGWLARCGISYANRKAALVAFLDAVNKFWHQKFLETTQ